METKTFSIGSDLLGKVTTVIDRLNRRAAKLGVEPITLTKTAPELRRVEIPGGTEKWVQIVDVTLSLNIPKLADWSFVATIQHIEGGNLLLTVPRAEGSPALDLSDYRTCAPTCVHCGLERNRADTYLVLHAVTGLKQVGKNCLASYTGFGKSPEQAAALAEWLTAVSTFLDSPGGGDDDEGSEGGGSGRDHGVGLNRFLSYVVAVSRVHGFRTRKQAEACQSSSTAEDALYNMEPPPATRRELITPTDEDTAFALAARAWGAALVADSDFNHNLKVVSSADGVLYRNLGIAAYVIQAYRKHLGAIAERAAAPISTPFGTVGERLRKVVLTYQGSAAFDSQYGTTFIHRFITADGNAAIWKTGNQGGFMPGATVTVDATIKAHSDYKGRAQTVLTRVKEL